MALKIYKPSTAGQRGLVLINRSHLFKGRPVKSLVEGKRSTGGRNAKGRVTARHKGAGHKKLYRFIDFKRDNNVHKSAEVQRIEYDPNRTSFIALIKNQETGDLSYMLAPEGLSVGSAVHSGDNNEIRTGNTLLLKNIPVGVLVHNIEMKIGKGGQLVRSAGASAQIAGRDGHYVLIRLPSGEIRKIHGECRATIGIVSNGDHKNQYLSKAGRNRWKGRRPHVRGVAMNPIDHPHGGGEGKTSGGRHPVSPWGQSAKGKKTRRPKKASSKMIVSKRKK